MPNRTVESKNAFQSAANPGKNTLRIPSGLDSTGERVYALLKKQTRPLTIQCGVLGSTPFMRTKEFNLFLDLVRADKFLEPLVLEADLTTLVLTLRNGAVIRFGEENG